MKINENLKDTSNLQDINIDDTSTNEIPMIVDYFTSNEYIFAGIVIFIYVLICCIIGLFGPPDEIRTVTSYSLENKTETNIYHKIENISPKLHYVHIKLSSIKKKSYENISELILPMNAHYVMEKEGKRVWRTSSNFHQILLSFPGFNENSTEVGIFQDYYIIYDTLEVHFEINNASGIDFINVIEETNNPMHTKFELIFRYSYMVLAIIVLLLYMKRCNVFKEVSLFQQMTKILLIVSILGFNVFSYLLYTSPSLFSVCSGFVLFNFFESFIAFYLLLIFDDIRLRNTTKDNCFILSKAIYFLIRVVIEIFYALTMFSGIFNNNTYGTAIIGLIVMVFKLISDLVFIIWFSTLFLISVLTMDKTERNVVLLFGYVFFYILIYFLLPYIPFDFKDNSFYFMYQFGATTVLVMSMAFFTIPNTKGNIAYERGGDNENVQNVDNQIGSFEPDIESDEAVFNKNVV